MLGGCCKIVDGFCRDMAVKTYTPPSRSCLKEDDKLNLRLIFFLASVTITLHMLKQLLTSRNTLPFTFGLTWCLFKAVLTDISIA